MDKAPLFALPALTLLIGDRVRVVVGAVVGAETVAVRESERLDVALGLLTMATTPLHAPLLQPSRMTNERQDVTLEKMNVEAKHLPSHLVLLSGMTCSPRGEMSSMLGAPAQAPPNNLHGDRVT